MRCRQCFRLTRNYVADRERILIAQEDAAIRAALDSAATDEERAFVENVTAERERNRKAQEKGGR